MVQSIGNWLYLAGLLVPPTAVILGGLLLLAPRFKRPGTVATAHRSHAHV